MKNNFYAFWRTAIAVCLIFLCAYGYSQAQTTYHPPIQDIGSVQSPWIEVDTAFSHRMNYVFGSLEKQRVPKGLLLDYAFEFTDLSNYNGTVLADSNYVNDGTIMDIYRTLYTSRVHTSAAAMDLNALDTNWFNLRQPGRITLAGLYFQYARFRDDAASSNRITVSNDKAYDRYVSGVWQNPYQTERVFAVSPATNVYEGLVQQIEIPSTLWNTNDGAAISSLQLDAGDGQGYRTISFGQALSVIYPDTGQKVIKYRLNLSNGTSLLSHSKIRINPAIAPVAVANRLSSTSFQDCNPCEIEAAEAFDGQYARGYITIDYADPVNHVLKNPLIIVEGFDPGHILEPEARFGVNTINGFRINIENSNQLLTLLETNPQFDIIYVDWKRGTDNIKKNALLLKQIIREINAAKQPRADGTLARNVIIGQSMGGLVTRWALKSMENAGELHETGLFVSYDTPHQGANVPLGYQHMAHHVKNLYLRSGLAYEYEFIQIIRGRMRPARALSLSSTPAARQMLLYYVNEEGALDNTAHTNWQYELESLGYPNGDVGQPFRKVAISNGSECATTQAIAPGGLLLNLEGKVVTTFLGDLTGQLAFLNLAVAVGQPPLLLGVLNGRNEIRADIKINATAAGGGNRVYYNNITFKKTILWLIPVTVTLTNRSNNAPSGVISFDSYPGGLYDTDIDAAELSRDKTQWFYKTSVRFEHVPSFNFVPTTSALDIGSGSVSLTHNDYTSQYLGSLPPPAPKNTPFDNFTTTANLNGLNEFHTSINLRNGNWLADELDGGTAPSQQPFCGFDNVTLTGPNHMCSSAVYQVNNVPIGTTVNWSVTGTFSISGTNNNTSVTVVNTSTGSSGSGTVTATLTNARGTRNLSMNITSGSPVPSLSYVETIIPNKPTKYDFTATYYPGSTYQWYVNGVLQSSYTGNTFTTQVLCGMTKTVKCKQVNACGASAFSTEYELYGECMMMATAYPNPASSELTVSFVGDSTQQEVANEPKDIELYNNHQKMVYNKRVTQAIAKVPVQHLPKGIYYLKIIYHDKAETKRILIER